jgi:multidrug efflux pump subunit AcrB
MVDLDLQALQARGLSALDVSTAINAQNLLLPAGNVKMGEREYTVRLNSSPDTVAELNDLPIKYVNGGASIMASATPFCFCTTQKHLSVKIVIISMA